MKGFTQMLTDEMLVVHFKSSCLFQYNPSLNIAKYVHSDFYSLAYLSLHIYTHNGEKNNQAVLHAFTIYSVRQI